ncbi:unnamed protein product [marine sediment metagenome]|uniref:Uncharacterized protein n=1 Tax=marine sediment metagenome TaxID=412755 RepID=X1AQW1_9ZZZZ
MNKIELTEKDCDKPEIRDSHKNGCPKEQRKKCHGNVQEKK